MANHDKGAHKMAKKSVALTKAREALKKTKEQARRNASRLRQKLSVDAGKIGSAALGGGVAAIAGSYLTEWLVDAFPEYADVMPMIVPAGIAVIGGAVAMGTKSETIQWAGIGVAVAGAVQLVREIADRYSSAEPGTKGLPRTGALGTLHAKATGAAGTMLYRGAQGMEERSVPVRNEYGEIVGEERILRAVYP